MLHEADEPEGLWGWLRQCVETRMADAENPFRLFAVLEDPIWLYRDRVAMGPPIPLEDNPAF